ncbi:nuclear transport factor 2 family protein [Rhodococcus qingshengii]|uniref:nuclear transport factor 2 family protein n=1 Tax=Rhodococcus qingshengii TaxID=334542 RepID=UPI001BECFDC3|nr:nuclear transport factor 2 family protein [Rhodococcus qingshengii]MBT2270084.1 hypothetical protein [Rhodococcus qingshengii]
MTTRHRRGRWERRLLAWQRNALRRNIVRATHAAPPRPFVKAIDALNAGDPEGFVRCFAPNGEIEDWGLHARGDPALRHWAYSHILCGRGDAIEVLETKRVHNRWQVTLSWFSTRSQILVLCNDHEICSLRIGFNP